MEDKILKLTTLWYKYVGMDHHKERDCHWYIIKVWSYGGEPYYCIDHHGYIFSVTDNRHCKTYEAAGKALCREIHKAFKKEMKWAASVIERENEYDVTQLDRARWLIKNYKEE